MVRCRGARHEAANDGRRASLAQFDETFHLAAQFGVAQGEAISEILGHFEQAEFDAEWAELRERFGDAACPDMLERTAGQRRADAVHAVFLAAASAAPGAQPPEPVVNIVIDEATWEAHLARAVGEHGPPLPDPATVAERCCETVDGTPVDPADAVVAGMVGHVRRVVRNSAGVTIELGRLQRLFTGSARVAALLQGRRCLWPGCGRRRCQVDHTVDWSRQGPTDPRNAGLACPRHNRFKTRGFRVRRDDKGRWHTFRPDGTEIRAA